MKFFNILIALTILLCSGCTTDFDKFNEQALKLVKVDKKLDKLEYEELINSIKQSDERGFQQYLER